MSHDKPCPPQGWDIREGTLGSELRLSGRGLHTGRRVNVRVLPRSGRGGERGVLFRRVERGEILAEVPAAYKFWRGYPLCSTLQASNGLLFRTVEHLLAALLFGEIDHAVVELDGEEVPILDGGAVQWAEAIHSAGRTRLSEKRKFIRILKPFTYRFGSNSDYAVEPAPEYRVSATVRVAGFELMNWHGPLTPVSFFSDIAPARTYGHLLAAVSAIFNGWLTGKPVLRGASLSSAAAIFNGRVIGGTTMPDEFARHRVLDMAGDFAIAGAPVLGSITARQPSHRRNQKFMRTLLHKHKDCWEWVSYS